MKPTPVVRLVGRLPGAQALCRLRDRLVGELERPQCIGTNSIMRVLQRRLQSVPAYIREKLDAIRSVERLEEILDQALTVGSAEELRLDDETSN